MLKGSLFISLIGATVLSMGLAMAADQDRTQLQNQTRDQLKDQDRIYGSQLMTRQERNDFRARMRAAKTAQEREQIRNEHHERMKIRAKERGVTLPDEPPAMGGGMGFGGGMGGGMGPDGMGGGMMGPGGR
jgi:hypothetical protein